MAIQFTVNTQNLQRAGAYLDATNPFTLTLWSESAATTPSGGTFRTLWNYGDINGVNPYIYLGSQTDSRNLVLGLFDGVTYTESAVFTPGSGTWASFAVVSDGATAVMLRVNGTLIDTLAVDLSAFVFVETDEYVDAVCPDFGVAYLREWQAALTAGDIAAEAASPTPVRTASILTNTPLPALGNLVDTVAGRNWTATGTPTYLTGPLPPANTDPTTATVISSFPYTQTLYVQDAPTGTGYVGSCTSSQRHAAWWKYTAVAGDVVLAVTADTSAGTSYLANTALWVGTPPSLTEYSIGGAAPLCGVTAGGLAINVPVTPGTTYYFQIVDKNSTEPLAADLVLTVIRPSVSSAPAGSLLVLNDSPAWPAWLLSGSDGTLLRPLTLPASEQAAFLPSGVLATWAEDVITDDVASLNVYAADYSLIATVTSLIIADQSAVGPITTNGVDTFYLAVCDNAAALAAVIYTANATGTVTGPTWTLPVNSKGISGMAVSPDESTLYYVTNALGAAVHAYDLVGHAALPDLVAGVGGTRHGRDVLVIDTGDILVMNLPGTTGNVTRYNPAGVLQQTYPGIPNNAGSAPRMSHALTDATFKVMAFPAVIGGVHYSRFMTFTMTTAAGTEFDVPFLEAGTSVANVPFGPSQSCPLLVLPLGVVPPTPPVVTVFKSIAIRRMRRTPHLNSLHKRLTFNSLEILAQVGEGLSQGQGVDPQAILRWSDDGGRTWSREHWTTLGKLGSYRTRVLWRRLGQARDRVFEVVVSDPVDVALITAYVDAKVGTS